MTAALAEHPDAEQLARFRLGDLSPDEIEEIAAHVARCSSCCGNLKQLPDDSFVGLVRQSLPAGADDKPGLPADLVDHPRYEVLELLGWGGMGSVYKARHRLMDRLVALKVIRHRLLDRPGVVERFHREMKAAGNLLHPNIVTAHDAEQAGDTHFLVMEFVEGVTLAQHVAERGLLPVTEACDYVRQAALALQHAHERGMVHRDIKPHNLMRTADGRIKVLDFGLARFASEVAPGDGGTWADEDGDGMTTAGMVLGTVEYIAPEQRRDPHAADIRADIYSLGRTLCFLLTGQSPSPENKAMHKLALSGLDRVLDRMLAADPAGRYQTPAEAAAALAPFADARRRRPITHLLIALALLLFGAGGLSAAVYRIATDKGEIIIETDDPSVEVIIRQGGKEVTILDPKTQHKVELRAGQYEIALGGAGGDLRLSTNAFTLKRGDKKLVTVRRVEPGAAPVVGTTWSNVTPQWQQPMQPSPFEILPHQGRPKPAPKPAPQPADKQTIGELRRFEGHTDGVYSVALSPDGKLALSGAALSDSDPSVRLWDVASGKEVRRLAGHTAGVTSVAFSPDGKTALSGSDDHTIRLWDVVTGRQLKNLEGHTDKVLTAAFSPDGKLIASGSRDKTVRLWDATTGKAMYVVEGYADAVRTVAFSPDGTRLASGSFDRTVQLWDVATGKKISESRNHTEGVQSVAFSPDGKRLASGGLDGRIFVLDAATGKIIEGPRAHPKGVSVVAFTADNRYILTGGHDGKIALWNIATGERESHFIAHKGAVRSLTVSPDGSSVLSGGDDKLLRLWPLPHARR
jgi:WD40 repeat protein/tRNA A-37 threonylcarbamoyl transferase component Bud32